MLNRNNIIERSQYFINRNIKKSIAFLIVSVIILYTIFISYKLSPSYEFETITIGSQSGFTVRNDIHNGSRCLMPEGMALIKWEVHPSYEGIPVPISVCEDQIENLKSKPTLKISLDVVFRHLEIARRNTIFGKNDEVVDNPKSFDFEKAEKNTANHHQNEH